MEAITDKFKINSISIDDWKEYKTLWLDALTSDPQAFAFSYEELAARTDEQWLEKTRKYSMGSKNKIFIAKDGNNTIGMMGFFENKSGAANLFGVYIKPAYRGKKIGNTLMGTTLDHLKNQTDFNKIELTVNKNQIAAVEFYKRRGFTVIKEIPNVKMGDGSICDEYFMEKHI